MLGIPQGNRAPVRGVCLLAWPKETRELPSPPRKTEVRRPHPSTPSWVYFVAIVCVTMALALAIGWMMGLGER